MLKSSGAMRNKVEITIERNGEIIDRRIQANITCDVGRSEMVSRLADTNVDTDAGVAKYIAIGSSATAATISDTTLVAETTREPLLSSYTVVTGTQCKLYARIPAGSAYTVNEVGMFTGGTATGTANSGFLLARSVLGSPVVKGAADVMTIEWTVNIVNHP